MHQYMEQEDIDALKLDSSEAMEFHYFKVSDTAYQTDEQVTHHVRKVWAPLQAVRRSPLH